MQVICEGDVANIDVGGIFTATCSVPWTAVESIPFDISLLDPLILSQAWGAGFTIFLIPLLTMGGLGVALGFIRRGR